MTRWPGFDRYIETAGDVIFLTDSVQQLRSLEDALRYRLSDEGTREKVNEIRNDRSWIALERHQKIDEALQPESDDIQKLLRPEKRAWAAMFPTLHEYINNLRARRHARTAAGRKCSAVRFTTWQRTLRDVWRRT